MATINITVEEGKYDIGAKYDSASISKIIDGINPKVTMIGKKAYNISYSDPIVTSYIPNQATKDTIRREAVVRMCLGLFIRSGCVKNMNLTNSATVPFVFEVVGGFTDARKAAMDKIAITFQMTYGMVSDSIAKSGIQSACIRGFMKALSTSDLFTSEYKKVDSLLKQSNSMEESKTILAKSQFLAEPASFKRIRPKITNPHKFIIECIDFLDTSFFELDDQVVRALSSYTGSRAR